MIHDKLRLQLVNTPSGHLAIPGVRYGEQQSGSANVLENQVYAAELDIQNTESTKGELGEIHCNLGH